MRNVFGSKQRFYLNSLIKHLILFLKFKIPSRANFTPNFVFVLLQDLHSKTKWLTLSPTALASLHRSRDSPRRSSPHAKLTPYTDPRACACFPPTTEYKCVDIDLDKNHICLCGPHVHANAWTMDLNQNPTCLHEPRAHALGADPDGPWSKPVPASYWHTKWALTPFFIVTKWDRKYKVE